MVKRIAETHFHSKKKKKKERKNIAILAATGDRLVRPCSVPSARHLLRFLSISLHSRGTLTLCLHDNVSQHNQTK
jgi:hypothetical protein